MVKPLASWEKKGDQTSFIEGTVGRGCYKQKVHWRKLGIWRVLAFHWLNFGSPSLAGLLLGKEKFFFPEAGVVKYRLLPAGNARCSLPIRVCDWPQVVGPESTFFWPPDSILVRFSFIHFYITMCKFSIKDIKSILKNESRKQNIHSQAVHGMCVNGGGSIWHMYAEKSPQMILIWVFPLPLVLQHCSPIAPEGCWSLPWGRCESES